MLERKGFRILASTTGEKGLQLVNKEYPDLVLLDVMIPDINGYEIARSIRTNPATENTPIIMFTARSQVDDKVEGLEAGADAYITKPARPRELFAQVNSVLKRAPQHSSAPTAVVADKGTLIGIISAKGGIGNSTLATNWQSKFTINQVKRLFLLISGQVREQSGWILIYRIPTA